MKFCTVKHKWFPILTPFSLLSTRKRPKKCNQKKRARASTKMTASQRNATISSTSGAHKKPSAASGAAPSSQSAQNHHQVSSYLGSSVAFQQVKQTQASLARLTRVHQQQQQQQQQIQSQSSQQVKDSNSQQQQNVAQIRTTFVDCLIRRFKDCFSEDFCTVPMFVVGNLSPGSDGKWVVLKQGW